MHLGSVLLVPSCRSPKKKRKEKTTPFSVNLMRSQISYQAARESTRNIFHAQAALCWLDWWQSAGRLKSSLVLFTKPAFKMVGMPSNLDRRQQRAGQSRAIWCRQGRAGEAGEAGQGRAQGRGSRGSRARQGSGQGRAGQGRGGQDRAGWCRAVHSRAR